MIKIIIKNKSENENVNDNLSSIDIEVIRAVFVLYNFFL